MVELWQVEVDDAGGGGLEGHRKAQVDRRDQGGMSVDSRVFAHQN
jgi:hypothetical protein